MTDRHTTAPFPFRPYNPATMGWVKAQAEQLDRSVNWYLNRLIEQAKQQQEAQCPKP